LNLKRWLSTPTNPAIDSRNFLNVQIDAIGIGLANSAAPFLPVFLTRLGASNFQVGLLTSMPAFTGFLLAIAIGNFLQSRRNIVPWFSTARLLVVASFTLTGLVTLVVPEKYAVIAVLAIWALATLPQTIVSIAFAVVMNAVAGPSGRLELMTHRWSIMGFTSATTVILVGLLLDRIDFPLNYQLVFIGLSIGGLISFYYSSHIHIPDSDVPPRRIGVPLSQRIREYTALILSERPFVSFASKRLVYMMGVTLATPLFPLYLVREVQASDAWIGAIATAQTAILIVGYFVWMNQSRQHGSRRVLRLAALGLSFYPALVALTHDVRLIVVYAGIAGIFQAGLDLVFFDELMKTVPIKYSATFVSVFQSLNFFSSIIAPLIGTTLADTIGLSGALLCSFALRFLGFCLFAFGKPVSMPAEQIVQKQEA
jgi:hypothetical protein